MVSTQFEVGVVASLWRYPVKSMAGEELTLSRLGKNGLLGDRGYALIDKQDGKVVTAKNPKKWSGLLDCQATLMGPVSDREMPGVQIKLPDGTTLSSEQPDLNKRLSEVLGREVFLAVTQGGMVTGVNSSLPASWVPNSEEYRLDIGGQDEGKRVTDFELPEGTFFDCGMVHLLTTATLAQLKKSHPEGRFEIQRFRPNIVVESNNGENNFMENDWVGNTLAIGDEVRLNISGPCPRCVMTTLAQGELSKDTRILRTAVEQNQGNVGVYAQVVKGGTVRKGDPIRFEKRATGNMGGSSKTLQPSGK